MGCPLTEGEGHAKAFTLSLRLGRRKRIEWDGKKEYLLDIKSNLFKVCCKL
jgi:hypothetical protein